MSNLPGPKRSGILSALKETNQYPSQASKLAYTHYSTAPPIFSKVFTGQLLFLFAGSKWSTYVEGSTYSKPV